MILILARSWDVRACDLGHVFFELLCRRLLQLAGLLLPLGSVDPPLATSEVCGLLRAALRRLPGPLSNWSNVPERRESLKDIFP